MKILRRAGSRSRTIFLYPLNEQSPMWMERRFGQSIIRNTLSYQIVIPLRPVLCVQLYSPTRNSCNWFNPTNSKVWTFFRHLSPRISWRTCEIAGGEKEVRPWSFFVLSWNWTTGSSVFTEINSSFATNWDELWMIVSSDSASTD